MKIMAVFNLRYESGRLGLAGVLDYLSGKRGLDLHLTEPGEAFDLLKAKNILREGYAGVLATVPGTDEAMSELARAQIPLVLVNIPKIRLSENRTNVSFVWTDNFDIGEKAAAHLLETAEIKSFGFVHADDTPMSFWSKEREIAFRRTVRPCGRPYSVCPEGKLECWLAKIPKPAGVMASFDARAADVIAACRKLKLDIPSQVSVIGVDNDESWFEGAKSPLSSVVPDFRTMGYRAMEELDRLVRNRRRSRPREIVIPAKDLIVRDSTSHLTPAARLVCDLHTFVNAHLQEDIHVSDIVRHLDCSRRLLELRLREEEGTSVRKVLETARLDKALSLIRTSARSAAQIATACGFKSPTRLFHLVRRHFGCSLGELRRKVQQQV